MTRLSVVVSAFNEEKKIKDCLESVQKLGDEIIFVDNTSLDKTVEIAQKYTSKIFRRPNNPMLNINKNFGFSKATGDWVLSLDADERVTPELRKEIEEKIGNTRICGYWIPRKNIIFGKWIQHTGWYPDYQLRLFKKGQGRFEEQHVHEMIKINGEAGYLKEHLIHYNYETVAQFLQKIFEIYAPNEAENLIKEGYVLNWLDVIRFPLKEFLSRFFAREGYRDGLHGLTLSLLMAFYHLIIFVKIWEEQGFKEVRDKDLLEKTQKEFENAHREIMFWFFNEKEKSTQNFFKKLWLKVQRRFP